MAKEVLLVSHNHWDPTWRRCFDRPSTSNGVTVRSYAELEEHVINEWLSLAPRGYTFSEGQAAVWRKYLERNPDAFDRIRQHASDGTLAVMMAGETVQDTNMPSAEGLVRNFLTAMPLYRELVGEDHPGLKLGWVEDAFGNSPNYPQVLKGVGAEIACMTTYRCCPEDVWVGIDGTAILCMDRIPRTGFGQTEKQPPCPSCSGTGCEACGDTGFRFYGGFDLSQARTVIENAIAGADDTAVVFFGGEEVLPDAGVADLVDELNARHGQIIRFATPTDVYTRFRDRLDRSAAESDSSPTPDLNPAMPGCMVSRIRLKQRTRAIAYKLVAAEGLLANRTWENGEPSTPPEEFAKAWRLVAFNQFHDAITGTHIDCANAELMEMLDEAEAIADSYLPEPEPEPDEAFGLVDSEPMSIRLGVLDVSFDLTGILSVRSDGRDVFGEATYNPLRRGFRIGELVLEADYGDAWGTRIEPMFSPQQNLSQIQLGDYNETVDAAENAIRWTGTYSGGDPKTKSLSWMVTVRPSADGTRLDFETHVDWSTESRRLRVMFPVASQSDTTTYEVPFGFIERKYDPGRLNYTQWNSNTLEFPALHWARRSVDDQSGVAILNRGLPCYRWVPGRMEISLLRSPEWQWCVAEIGYYEFWNTDGMRDTGRHRFEYSIRPYYDGLAEGDLTREGYGYNMPIPLTPPFDIEGDVVVTAWKPSEDGQGWVLRLQEAGGKGTPVSIRFDGDRRVTVADLLERPIGEEEITYLFSAEIHRHGILTLRIR